MKGTFLREVVDLARILREVVDLARILPEVVDLLRLNKQFEVLKG
jgi:hypothetical protein